MKERRIELQYAQSVIRQYGVHPTHRPSHIYSTYVHPEKGVDTGQASNPISVDSVSRRNNISMDCQRPATLPGFR
jgi:hypothetical protein